MQKKRNRRAAPMEERFWPKVDRNGPVPEHRPELGPCWIWTAACYPNGYGMFGLGRKGAGVKGAHIVSWELANGRSAEGQFVCHHCDRKRCVRPEHLFIGTPTNNVQDMIEKGRAKWQTDPTFSYQQRGDTHWMRARPESVPRGEARSQVKLTEDDVREIRVRSTDGESKASLARTFDVSEALIRSVVCRRSWKHVA